MTDIITPQHVAEITAVADWLSPRSLAEATRRIIQAQLRADAIQADLHEPPLKTDAMDDRAYAQWRRAMVVRLVQARHELRMLKLWRRNQMAGPVPVPSTDSTAHMVYALVSVLDRLLAGNQPTSFDRAEVARAKMYLREVELERRAAMPEPGTNGRVH